MQVQMNAPLQPTEGRGGSTRWYCQCRIPLEVLGDGPKLCRDSRFCRFEPAGQAAKKNNGRNLPFEWRDQGTDSGTSNWAIMLELANYHGTGKSEPMLREINSMFPWRPKFPPSLSPHLSLSPCSPGMHLISDKKKLNENQMNKSHRTFKSLLPYCLFVVTERKTIYRYMYHARLLSKHKYM